MARHICKGYHTTLARMRIEDRGDAGIGEESERHTLFATLKADHIEVGRVTTRSRHPSPRQGNLHLALSGGGDVTVIDRPIALIKRAISHK